jgi:hypothetical protein
MSRNIEVEEELGPGCMRMSFGDRPIFRGNPHEAGEQKERKTTWNTRS